MASMHYLRRRHRGLQDCGYRSTETKTEYGHRSSVQRGITVSSDKGVQQEADVSNSSVFAVLVVSDLFLIKSTPSIETDSTTLAWAAVPTPSIE